MPWPSVLRWELSILVFPGPKVSKLKMVGNLSDLNFQTGKKQKQPPVLGRMRTGGHQS